MNAAPSDPSKGPGAPGDPHGSGLHLPHIPLPAAHSGDRHTHEGEHGHTSVGQYYIVGLVLAVLTGIEVAVFYIPALEPVLVPILLMLTTGKFALVVMFFMHLRSDSKVFSGLFLAGLMLAIFMIGSLVILFHYLPTLER